MHPRTGEYETSSAFRQTAVYHADRSAAFGGISLTTDGCTASDITGPASRARCRPPSARSVRVSLRSRRSVRMMPKRTRIYTRTGDDGTTGLVGGRRTEKNALRIETYGTVDELSSAIGVARTALMPA